MLCPQPLTHSIPSLSLSPSPSLPLPLPLPLLLDKSLEELEKLITLLLGCAVQCENKTTLIQKMMAMEKQQGLVPYIQQVE